MWVGGGAARLLLDGLLLAPHLLLGVLAFGRRLQLAGLGQRRRARPAAADRAPREAAPHTLFALPM